MSKDGDIMLKMYKKHRQFIIGFVLASLLFGGVGFAANSKTIEAFYKDIKLQINGKAIDTGEDEPFIYAGRTYLPARYVAEGLGATVKWNESTNTVEIDSIETANVTQPTTTTSIPSTIVNQPSTSIDNTNDKIPTNFNTATLSEDQEYVWYNGTWCIKQGYDYFIEMQELGKLYLSKGISFSGTNVKRVGDKRYPLYIFDNINLRKDINDTNIPAGSYYREVGQYKFRAVQVDTTNPNDYIKVGKYEYVNLKYILELLSYNE